MIYITGDTHGEQARFTEMGMPSEMSWTKDDYLIVCGDFGFLFADDKKENAFLDLLENTKPYTICFCDGNHENFPAIFSYPEEKWNGGRIHRIRKNIIYLMRGQVFDICGKSIFTMGGAYSIDRYLRTPGISYWKEELPDNSEYREAAENLKERGNKVDIIITHTAPREIVRYMGMSTDTPDAELTGFLEWIMHDVAYDKWFFGHVHSDREIYGKFRAVWFDVIML